MDVQFISPSPSHIATDGQSVSLSLCRAPSGAHDRTFVTVWQLLSCPWEGVLSDERTGLSFVSVSQQYYVNCHYVHLIYTLYVLHDYTIYTWPLSVRAQYSRLCPISGSFCNNGSQVTWMVVWLTAAKFKHFVFSVTGFALFNGANVFIIMILYDLCLLPA
jgi:hypothetical protein